MKRQIRAILHGMMPEKPNEAVDRELLTLRSRLNVESLGLKRAAIMARTQLIEEILKRPEQRP
jgi:hypothetical protein